VNWSGGQYELVVRNGRIDGANGALKKSVRMVVEGCVLDAGAEPVGAAVDVAPEGFTHPVYRSGIALSLLIPPPRPQSEDRRAIEEIIPPELEATPFPMPAPKIQESEYGHTLEPEPEPASEPEREPTPLEEPQAEPEPAPVKEPEPEPAPLQEPEEESAPVKEPEPEPEPAHEALVEVIPEDSTITGHPAETESSPHKDNGYEI
jgi:outer membrane biosynthesis protein TonB